MDYDGIVALNRLSESETSAMDRAALQELVDTAFHMGLRGEGREAFLIALDQASAHDGVNFNWFRKRHKTFVYVDRIVVAADHRGKGHARGLYTELIALARAAGHSLLCCEVNVDPPNTASLAFHARMGFAEVGRAVLAGKGKTVAYLERQLHGLQTI